MSIWDNISSGVETGFSGLTSGLNSLLKTADNLAGSDLGKIGTELILANNAKENRIDSTTQYIASPDIPVINQAGQKSEKGLKTADLYPFIFIGLITIVIIKVIK